MQKKRLPIILLLTVMFGSHIGCSGQHEKNPENKVDRQPAVAGQFYSDNPTELRSMIEGFYAQVKSKPEKNIAAVISPHAGYVFSGPIAAEAYAQIDPDREFDNVFVLASSHQHYFMGASIYNLGDYVTPLGKVPVNIDLANNLIEENPVFQFHPDADKREHSLEVQIPFLQVRLNKPFKLVPIILGTQSPESCEKIAEALLPFFNEKNLFVVSSDFSHYPSYEDAKEADQATCDAITSGDPGTFLDFLKKYKKKDIPNLATNCCGWTSVTTLLYMTSEAGDYQYEPVAYINSGDSRYGDRHQVVGYWAIAVKRTQEFVFTDAEQKELLEIARQTIESWIGDHKVPKIDATDFSDNLMMHAGAFVTLHKNGALRGCIGRFTADIPLYRVIQEMAIAAATEDPRFPQVSENEIKDLNLEISVLSPMRKMESIEELELGKHGIYIKKGFSGGTFLPQVATETGWNKEEFLGHCSRDKAGLGWDGWKTSDVFVYEAFVFGEKKD
jgi:MEMO1 family protein